MGLPSISFRMCYAAAVELGTAAERRVCAETSRADGRRGPAAAERARELGEVNFAVTVPVGTQKNFPERILFALAQVVLEEELSQLLDRITCSQAS